MKIQLEGLEINCADDVSELVSSIKEIGLLHPITVQSVNGSFKILAGMKRAKACLQAGLSEIDAEVSDKESRLVTIHENLQRGNLDWPQISALVAELHELRVGAKGQTASGRPSGDKTGWSMRDTARELGRGLGTVAEDLMLVKAVQADPALRNVKNRNTAVQMVRNKIKQLEMNDSSQKTVKFEVNQVFNGDAYDILSSFPGNSFHACITDPPWDQFRDKSLTKDDRTEKVFDQVYKVLSHDSFLFVFCGLSDFIFYRDYLRKLGFSVQDSPAIWYKPDAITFGTRKWEYQRDYEMILIAVKGNPVLTLLTKYPGVLSYNQVHPSKLIHPNEKPRELIDYILKTCSYKESLILDPFGGSGVVADSAFNLGRRYIIIERDRDAYEKIKRRLK